MRLFVLWLVIAGVLGVEGQVKSTMIDLGTYFTRNLRLTNQSVFRSLTPPSFSHCVQECVLSKACTTMTFDLRDGLCELADNNAAYLVTTDQRYITTASTTPGIIPPYVTALSGVCDGNTCSSGTSCVRLSSGVPHCVITECSIPSPVPLASPSSVTNRSVGVVITYTCDPTYVAVGGSNRTCKADGTWTGVTFTCEPAPFDGTFEDQSLYADFQQADTACNGQLPVLEAASVISAFASTSASFPGYCGNCPGVLTATQTTATMFSENWPDSYQNYGACSCLINTLSITNKMRLEIISMDMESCCDNLYIYDGPDETFPIFGKYTGTITTTEIIVSSTNQVYMEFRSDASVIRAGFELRYTEVQANTPSTAISSLTPPATLPLYYWVSGQIDESDMVWKFPDGTPITQTVSMSPSFTYLQNQYNTTGNYYNGVPFSAYRLCFRTTTQNLYGFNPALINCHAACQISGTTV